MYYVIQVAPHEEARIEALLREMLPNGINVTCFHLMRRIQKKFKGAWHEVREKLIPGYVFVETDVIKDVHEVLRRTGKFARLLGRAENFFTPLNERDIAWLIGIMNYCDGEAREVPLSDVEITEDGTVRIVSGPLKQMESMVRKIGSTPNLVETTRKYILKYCVHQNGAGTDSFNFPATK